MTPHERNERREAVWRIIMSEHETREREIRSRAIAAYQQAETHYTQTINQIVKLANDLSGPVKATLEETKKMLNEQLEKEWRDEQERFSQECQNVKGRIMALAWAERKKKRLEAQSLQK